MPDSFSRGRDHRAGAPLLLLLLTLLLLAACGSGGPVNHSNNPLVAQYDVNAPAGSTVAIQFGTDTNYGQQTWAQAAPASGGNMTMLVAGMKQSTEYHMRAVTTLSDGTTKTDIDHIFHTGSVDASRLATFTTTGNQSAGRGIELINLTLQPGTSSANDLQAVATDLVGNVIWYYDHDSSEGSIFPIKLLPNGHMLMNISDSNSKSYLREVDLAGNKLAEYTVGDLNKALPSIGFSHTIDFFHHDFLRLANGHTILLVADTRELSGLTGYPPNTKVQGDDIVDLDQNMKPVWIWSAFDHLDPNRHPLAGLPDWTHGNALVYTPDHNLLFSMRNQSWVIKIDYQDGAGTGDVLWKLGYQGDFTLTNGDSSDWFYGQHYPHIFAADSATTTLGVFDDGNDRVFANGTTCNTNCYSRAVIYDLDENAKTATLQFAYDPNLYTFWGGDVRLLSSGDVELDIPAPAGLQGSRVQEITQDANPQVVWQMDMSVPNAYRAYRIPSLYPGVQW